MRLDVPRNSYIGALNFDSRRVTLMSKRESGASADVAPNKRSIMPLEIECGRSGKKCLPPAKAAG
jgi:hypothetical protein